MVSIYLFCISIFCNNSINFFHLLDLRGVSYEAADMWSDLNRKLSATNTPILHCLALDFALSVVRDEQVYGIRD
jgi:hypothetical protein